MKFKSKNLKTYKLITVHLKMCVNMFFVTMANVSVISIVVNVSVITGGKVIFVKKISTNGSKEIIVRLNIVFVSINLMATILVNVSKALLENSK